MNSWRWSAAEHYNYARKGITTPHALRNARIPLCSGLRLYIGSVFMLLQFPASSRCPHSFCIIGPFCVWTPLVTTQKEEQVTAINTYFRGYLPVRTTAGALIDRTNDIAVDSVVPPVSSHEGFKCTEASLPAAKSVPKTIHGNPAAKTSKKLRLT